MNIIDIGGARYVKASDAAKRFGYAQDYIGQLVRAGKISGQQIGRTWYVREDELTGHKESKGRSNKKKTQEALHKALSERSEAPSLDASHAIYNSLTVPSEHHSHLRERLLGEQVRYERDETPLLVHPHIVSVHERDEKGGKDLHIVEEETHTERLVAEEPPEAPLHGQLAVTEVADTSEQVKEEEAEPSRPAMPKTPHKHVSPYTTHLEHHKAPSLTEKRAHPVPVIALAGRRQVSLTTFVRPALVPLLLLLAVAFGAIGIFGTKTLVYQRSTLDTQTSYGVTSVASVLSSIENKSR